MIRLLLGMRGGVFGFDPDGAAPARMLLAGVQPKALAVDPADAARVYCATYNRGLWRSEDAGETWLPVGTPQDYTGPYMPGAIGPRETTCVSVDPEPGAGGRHAVWVGTEPSTLSRSDDHGETFAWVTRFDLPSRTGWSFPPRPTTHHVQCLAHGVGAQGGGVLHVAIEAGATLRSRDGGRTFEDRRPGSPLDVHTLLTHPAAPGRLYAALGDAFLTRGHCFAESRDDGNRWHYSGRGLEATPYLYGLAVDPADPDDVRVAASPDPRAAHLTGASSIFRRDGDRWVEDAEGFPRDRSLVPVLGTDPTTPGRWFALSNLGLFRKEPGDVAWARLAARDEWRAMNPMSLVSCGR